MNDKTEPKTPESAAMDLLNALDKIRILSQTLTDDINALTLQMLSDRTGTKE